MPTFKSVGPKMTKLCSEQVYKGLTLHQIKKILALFKFKAFAVKKKATEKLKSFMERIENIVRIWENASYQYFSFSQCFKNSPFS